MLQSERTRLRRLLLTIHILIVVERLMAGFAMVSLPVAFYFQAFDRNTLFLWAMCGLCLMLTDMYRRQLSKSVHDIRERLDKYAKISNTIGRK